MRCMKEGTSEGESGRVMEWSSLLSASVFAIEAGAGKVHAAEWEGVDVSPSPPFNAQGVLECSCGQSSFCPQQQAVTIISSFILEIGGEERRGEKKRKTWVAHTTTTHCALRTAHPHPTYSIVSAGVASGHFPVECSVDLSHPAFGRVAQVIISTIIKTAHVGSALACHHRKQQQRERKQPPRGRAGRHLQCDSCHHVRSCRAAPRSPCWECNLRGKTK